MKYIFLVNPFGKKEILRGIYAALSALKSKLGAEMILVHETEYAGHAKILAAQFAAEFGSQAIIFSCGGDGTAHEIANGLAYTDTAMSIIPLGTGNDFAKMVLTISERKKPVDLVSRIEQCIIQNIDLFRVSCFDARQKQINDWNEYCLNITSFGLDTAVQAAAKKIVSSTKRISFIRNAAYPAATVYAISKGWDYQVKYTFQDAITGDEIAGETAFILLAICNGSYYGGGYCPAPQAKLSDGILDVCVVEDMSLLRVIPLVSRYKAGNHLGHPKIKSYRVKSGVLQTVRPELNLLRGNYDGEDFWGAQIHFEVCSAALKYATLA